MATQRANGGVTRRWVNRRTGFRLVLCGNGRFLISAGAGVWRHWRERLSLADVERDGVWREVGRWKAD